MKVLLLKSVKVYKKVLQKDKVKVTWIINKQKINRQKQIFKIKKTNPILKIILII